MNDAAVQTYLMRMAQGIIVCIAGLLLALLLRARIRGAAPFVGLALGGKLVTSCCGFLLMRWMMASIKAGADPATIGFRNGLFGAWLSITDAMLLGLLVASVFVGRQLQVANVTTALNTLPPTPGQ